jgi:ferredoxin-NADP reductase
MAAVDTSRWKDAVVRSTLDVTKAIREIRLTPDGGVLDYAPGSHIDVAVRIGSCEQTRSYSLVGSATESAYRIAVRRSPNGRGGSLAMCELSAGDRIRISEPKNTFPLSFHRPDYLLIAGGVGITPLLGMATALRQNNARVRLIYAAKTSADIAFADELDKHIGQNWQRAISADNGKLDLQPVLQAVLPDGEVYVCGPVGLLEDARQQWTALGRPIECLRFETFASGGHFDRKSFTVELPYFGKSIVVGENESMLDALRRENIDVVFDCLRGECGLCVVPILEASGEIDHCDVFFSAAQKAQNKLICTCVSRAVGGSIKIDTGYRDQHSIL